MEINGVPVHPLVVHAAVVFTPLAVLFVWGFALRPSWRWALRWPAVALSLVSVVSVVAARVTGEWLLENRLDTASGQLRAQLETHQSRAGVLLWVTIALALVVLVASRTLGGPSALASGWGAADERGGALAARALPVVLVLLGLAALVWVVLTGDAGSRAVWS